MAPDYGTKMLWLSEDVQNYGHFKNMAVGGFSLCYGYKKKYGQLRLIIYDHINIMAVEGLFLYGQCIHLAPCYG